MQKQIINDLTQGSVFRKLITFALPFMLSVLLQTLYSMVDMMIVGRYVGRAGLSAVSVSSQFIWLTTALCMGFTNGGQIIISQLVGAGRRDDLNKANRHHCRRSFYRRCICNRSRTDIYKDNPSHSQHARRGFCRCDFLPYHCFYRHAVHLRLQPCLLRAARHGRLKAPAYFRCNRGVYKSCS
jgi:hypothetical protein